ncbi:MAG: hypothetical protein BroJett039_11790 [Chloroflexota bacterium]|nr:MAG: hypothetical protein BroJett039_11790 [Chloroflexota bacterium]
MGAKTFLNFDLALERAGENYRANVAQSPSGQATLELVRPFSPEELQTVFSQLSRNNAAAARAFGKKLYDAVFADEIKIAYLSSVGIAASQNAGLRVRLRLNETPELAYAPWEILHDGQDFLAFSPQFTLVRYLELRQPLKSFAAQAALRVLFILSSPRDDEPLDLAREWARLQDALADAVSAGLVEIELLEHASLTNLQEQLGKAQYHILHFSGHGMFDARAAADAPQGKLVFVNEDGRRQVVDALELGRLFKAHDSLRLVVLNACEGARADTGNVFAGAAQTLIEKAVPAVIAMQFPITDEAAQTFSRALYGAFADSFESGFQLETALSRARLAMQRSGLEWATPVLFSRQDENLFTLPALDDAQKRALKRAALFRQAHAALDAENFARAGEYAARLTELDAHDTAARDLREKIERLRAAAEFYAQGKTFSAQERWQDAVNAFKQVQARQMNYRDTTSLLEQATRALPAASPAAAAARPRADENEVHYKDMVRELLRAKVVPFLGLGTNLYGRAAREKWQPTDGAPSGDELARYLAANYDYDETDSSNLFRVSQYVAVTRDNSALYDELHQIFGAQYAPSPLHRFWAELPARLRARGPVEVYPILVTANYDLRLEKAFQEQGEAFDALIYLADGDDKGKFLQRTHRGEEILVGDPSTHPHMRLNERTTIIRVHGAASDSAYESFVVTEDHYLDLFRTDVMSLLPRTVAARLKESYVLFMGCNLRNWNMRGLLYRLAKTKYRPWLVQPQIQDIEKEYWRDLKVKVLDLAYDEFLENLNLRMTNALQGGAQ